RHSKSNGGGKRDVLYQIAPPLQTNPSYRQSPLITIVIVVCVTKGLSKFRFSCPPFHVDLALCVSCASHFAQTLFLFSSPMLLFLSLSFSLSRAHAFINDLRRRNISAKEQKFRARPVSTGPRRQPQQLDIITTTTVWW